MRVRVEHLLQDKKTGRVSYRRGVPAELRPFVGRSEIKRTLGVRLARGVRSLPPAALAAYTAAHEEAERILVLAASQASGDTDRLDESIRRALLDLHEHIELAEDDDGRRDISGEEDLHVEASRELRSRARIQRDPGPLRRHDNRQHNLETEVDILRDAYRMGTLPEHIAPLMEDFCAFQRLSVDVGSPEFKALCHEAVARRLGIAEKRLQRQRGEVVLTPTRPQMSGTGTVARRNSVSEAFAMCAAGETQTVATKMQWETAERYFVALHGDMPIGDITKRHAVDFKAALQALPARLSAAQREQILACGLQYAGPRARTLSPRTINHHIRTLHKIWTWAFDHDLVSAAGVSDNPFARLSLAEPKGRSAVAAGKSYSVEQLRTIFSQPVFTNGERPTRGRGEAAYWLPLLSLFTGARREELASLMVQDITLDPGSRRWQLTIGDQTPHPSKGPRDTKNHQERTIPVHRELIRLGFIDFVLAAAGAGEQALFPRLTVTNRRGQLAAKWGEWWGSYIRAAGVVTTQPAHAFRHTWTTAARACGVPKDAREYIQGHAGDGSTNDSYGDLSVLGREIDKLSYPGLDLSWLYVDGAVKRAAEVRR